MVFGAILAGGTGSRMHMGNMPKQFLMLGDKPIIIHTLEKFLTCSKFDRIYLGVHKDWTCYVDDLITKFVPFALERIKVVCGGESRNDTILNIVNEIETDFGESPDNLIVTHDSVRPFVTLRMIEENIEAVKKHGAIDTVVPSVDTIVISSDGNKIINIPQRSHMYQGQTPQSFRIDLLKNLYKELSVEEKAVLTDACKICVIRNYPVHLVEGSVLNMKITTPEDYKIAQAILGGNLE